VVAAHALAAAADRSDALGALLGGRGRVALVDDPQDQLGTGNTTHGADDNVVDGGIATHFLLLGGQQVRIVEARHTAVDARPCIDPTRRLARVRFEGAPAVVVSRDAAGVRDRATLLAAAEAAGVAERALELSVDYGKVREQFGRPIGAFQAIKHRCADMAVRAEVARSAVTYAAVAIEEDVADAQLAVHGAKSLATDAAIMNSTDNIQNHGGIGYTWEADAHLYLKRARLLEHVLGTRLEHLDAIAAPWRAGR
jgi:hypothetical protein